MNKLFCRYKISQPLTLMMACGLASMSMSGCVSNDASSNDMSSANHRTVMQTSEQRMSSSSLNQKMINPQIFTHSSNLGYVLDLKTGQRITPEQMLSRIAQTDHVLVGETHDNIKHHQAEYWLLKNLGQLRKHGSLLLEMLKAEQQEQVQKVQKSSSLNKRTLAQQLNWQKSWNWQFYGDIVSYPLEHDVPLIATNLNKNEINTILQGKAMPLNGVTSVTKDIKATIGNLIISSHSCDTCSLDNPFIKNMTAVQQFRDRRMAEKMLSSPNPNILFAGSHHVNRQFGAPVHLREMMSRDMMKDTADNLVIIMMRESRDGITKANADYLWIMQ